MSFSTASNNGNDGIAVGQNSLVTRNTAEDNSGDGIEAVSRPPSRSTRRLGNGLNFNPIGVGCVALHNNFDPR